MLTLMYSVFIMPFDPKYIQSGREEADFVTCMGAIEYVNICVKANFKISGLTNNYTNEIYRLPQNTSFIHTSVNIITHKSVIH